MVKTFYIEVKDEAHGEALAQHFERHEGLSFVTEGCLDTDLTDVVQTGLASFATNLPMKRYGEVTHGKV